MVKGRGLEVKLEFIWIPCAVLIRNWFCFTSEVINSIDCERSGTKQARSRELLPIVIWDSQTTQCLGNYWFFFDMSWRTIFFTIKSIFVMNRPSSARVAHGCNTFWWDISQSVLNIRTWKFYWICSFVLKLLYQTLEQKSLFVLNFIRFCV